MYQAFLVCHTYIRWLVVIGLLYAVIRSYTGIRSGRAFSAADNAVRHWVATVTHIQLVVGMVLYTQSPVVKYFWANRASGVSPDNSFFGIIHIALMLIAIILVTVASALARRRSVDNEKFKTMFVGYFIALIIIFIAIPWPFSPLAVRPYIR